LAREDLDELVHLLITGICVDVGAELPVPLRHHLGRVEDRDELQAADIGSLDLALLDVEGERGAAVVIGRAVVEREVARAHQIAGARLDVATADIPGHCASPSLAWCGDSATPRALASRHE